VFIGEAHLGDNICATLLVLLLQIREFSMPRPNQQVKQRLTELESHLKNENQLLVDVVKSFRNLDRVAYRLGLLKTDQSFAFQVPWWPMISILGTFSAGKSSFINRYVGVKVQESGTQAVDDKFTVMCYSKDKESRSLPGIALDADPRFPFYQMREELEKVSPSEGARIDSYLQLKTCPSDKLRGQILIDSPGFDADAQRTSTLRITEHIMNMSDLVLVLFDARRPEPGAMRDTLQHLVGDTVNRSDANKFLYILNQIDTTAKEDNPEEVVGAWQRAIAEKGLTAGKFYTIFNPEQARPIEDDRIRERLEAKSSADLADIYARITQVKVERFYRIAANLERTAHQIEDNLVPRLTILKKKWRKGVMWRCALLLFPLIGALVAAGVYGHLNSMQWWNWTISSWQSGLIVATPIFIVLIWFYSLIKKSAAAKISKSIPESVSDLGAERREGIANAFVRNSGFFNSIFRSSPVGWGWRSKKALRQVYTNADRYVQELNNAYTDPSGQQVSPMPTKSPSDVAELDKDNAQMAEPIKPSDKII
jgi:GTPase SAR1 family protein